MKDRPSALKELPLHSRFALDFMEPFRQSLDRDKQQMMMEMVYFGYSANRYNKWLVEVFPNSPSIRSSRNRLFAHVHDLFISYLEKNSPKFTEINYQYK